MSSNPAAPTYASVVRDEPSADFFDATTLDRLLIRRCTSCGHLNGPDAGACSDCGQDAFEWVDAIGEAVLVSWTVMHGRDGSTVIAGIAELQEGPWLNALLVEIEGVPLAVGIPLTVQFVDAGPERIPAFRPTGVVDD
jgi:uncharacterized OB-fold protein